MSEHVVGLACAEPVLPELEGVSENMRNGTYRVALEHVVMTYSTYIPLSLILT